MKHTINGIEFSTANTFAGYTAKTIDYEFMVIGGLAYDESTAWYELYILDYGNGYYRFTEDFQNDDVFCPVAIKKTLAGIAEVINDILSGTIPHGSWRI